MKPIVHGLEANYSDRINFIYLDIDDPNTAKLKGDLNFVGQPQYVLLSGDGKVIQQWFGFMREEEFVSAFNQILQ